MKCLFVSIKNSTKGCFACPRHVPSSAVTLAVERPWGPTPQLFLRTILAHSFHPPLSSSFPFPPAPRPQANPPADVAALLKALDAPLNAAAQFLYKHHTFSGGRGGRGRRAGSFSSLPLPPAL